MEQIVVHQTNILLGPTDHLIEAIDGVCLNQCLSYHKLDCLARLVEINLAEQLEASIEDKIDIVVNLAVVDDFVIDDRGVLNDAFVVDVGTIDLRVLQVAIQVVQLVKVKAVALVCHDIEEEELLRIVSYVVCRVALDEILDQLAVLLTQLS